MKKTSLENTVGYSAPDVEILPFLMGKTLCTLSDYGRDDSGDPGEPGEDPYPNGIIVF